MFELQEAAAGAVPTSNSKVNTAVHVAGANNNNNNKESADATASEGDAENEEKVAVRKPILVTEKVEVERRVPITTPRPTTASTTMTTTTTTESTTTTAATRVPLNKSQKVLQKTTTLAVSRANPDQGKVFQYSWPFLNLSQDS